jgi:hypothetical protein
VLILQNDPGAPGVELRLFPGSRERREGLAAGDGQRALGNLSSFVPGSPSTGDVDGDGNADLVLPVFDRTLGAPMAWLMLGGPITPD